MGSIAFEVRFVDLTILKIEKTESKYTTMVKNSQKSRNFMIFVVFTRYVAGQAHLKG